MPIAASLAGALGIVVAGVSALVAVNATALVAMGAAAGGPLSAWPGPSAQARAQIPPVYLDAFGRAAATCPGLPWTVLAGIARVESDFGADAATSPAGAVGPMQFLPSTFTAYAQPVPPGGKAPPSPLDPIDSVYAAARMLCSAGGRGGIDVPAAVYAYNHSWAYVSEVLRYAAGYAAPAPAPAPAAPGPLSAPAAAAVGYALAQIGTPYRWGGNSPAAGFDCSGLTQASYRAAGVAIPRTSEAQWATLPHVALAALQPGDLVFFDPGEFIAGLPGHVGIYVGGGEMVDAPHAGADVRIDPLAAWPAPFGAARPGG